MKIKILYFTKYSYKEQKKHLIDIFSKSDLVELIEVPENIDRKDLLSFCESIEFDVFIHKNEHCKLNTCPYIKEIISFCYSQKKVPCYFDFGYFDHYENYTIDYYLPNAQSSIKKIFYNLPTAHENLQEPIFTYLDRLKNKRSNNLNILNLEINNFCVIWAQYDVGLLRDGFLKGGEKNIINWFNKITEVIQDFKLTPVIKISPCEVNYNFQKIKGNPILIASTESQSKNYNLFYDKNINFFLGQNAHSHIINCSSISNELIIYNSKISATGISWFNDLEIFHEPHDWNSLLNFPNQNKENINKWINWWNIRQCPKNNIDLKIKEIFDEFHFSIQSPYK